MKKWFTITLSLLMATTLLAGCGGTPASDSHPPESVPDAGGQSAGAGDEGASEGKDTLVWAQSGDINSFDFHVGKQPLTFDVTCNMFDTLVKWDENNEVAPMLATEWESSGDRSITFKLRDDVTFHDGEPMTAEDVKYTYDRAMNHPVVKNNFSWLESTEVVDDYTVTITTNTEYSPVMNALTSPLAGIMPKHLLEADDAAMENNPVGTGPYKLKERKEGEHVTLEAYDAYWGGPAKTRYLTMKVVPEASQRTIMLETGEVDVAYDLLPSDVARLEENAETQVMAETSFKIFFYQINANTSNTPLKDPKVRQAIELAIDKQAVCDAVLYGHATPIGSLAAPGSFGYSDTITANPYNVEQAKSLLADAGYPDGFSMSLWCQPDQVRQEASVIVQDMLREVGIDMTIETVDGQALDDRIVKGEDYDMCSSMFYNLMGDADYVLYSNFSPDSASNFVHYDNPAVMEKLMAARSEQDNEKRLALYEEVYQMLAEDKPQVPMFAYENLVGMRSGVSGFTMSPITAYRYENVEVK